MATLLRIAAVCLAASIACLGQSLELSIAWQAFTPNGRVPEMAPYAAVYRATLRMDLDLARYRCLALFWDNRILGTIDPGQFRHVGWGWELGAHLCGVADVGYFHLSQHTLDAPGLPHGFPVQDGYFVKFYLIGPAPRPTLVP
jgi:hypothetical protein